MKKVISKGNIVIVADDGGTDSVYVHGTLVASYGDGGFHREICKEPYCESRMTMKGVNFLRERIGLPRISLAEWRGLRA